jgi:hypothetical protein
MARLLSIAKAQQMKYIFYLNALKSTMLDTKTTGKLN